jgi:hypothetical protein
MFVVLGIDMLDIYMATESARDLILWKNFWCSCTVTDRGWITWSALHYCSGRFQGGAMIDVGLALTRVVSILIGLLLVAAPAWAQASASGIAGTVKDTSGAVLPGVTVEASSPVLIEKVRSAVTDAQGNYQITELRPGEYAVAFALPGFSTVKREGVALTSGFTASVNAEMKVGSVEETITVTGAAPQVDVQNVRQQTVVQRSEIEALPVGQGSTSSLVSLIPGLGDGGLVDVGGTGGAWQAGRATYGTYHGKIGLRTTMDGMRTQNTGTGKAPGYTINMQFVEEVAVETGGITAEGSASAMAMNHVPKEGSNQLRFTLAGRFMSAGMQADNLDDKLRARGATTPQQVENLHDSGFYVGGPVIRDRLWFYTGVRRWGFRRQIPGLFENKTLGGLVYTEDRSKPVRFRELDQSIGGRSTFQASAKNKVNFFGDYQNMFTSHGTTGSPANAPETQNLTHLKPSGIAQASWTSTVSNKLLLEAGAGAMLWHQFSELRPEVSSDAISILETATNFRYNAPATYYPGDDPWKVDRFVQRFSAAYVTGSHNFKTGVQIEQGIITGGTRTMTGPTGAIGYRFFNGVPTGLDLSGTPYVDKAIMNPDLGIFAQDQWRLKRLTMNLGVRFDYWNGFIPSQTIPATYLLPERQYDKVDRIPNFKDINPRLGAAYDLFGNGRTAIKLSVGRYNDLSGLFYTQVADPAQTSIRSTTRAWTDSNGNFIPDCDLRDFARNGECGAIANQNFGRINPNAVRFDDEVTRGWGKRPYTWDIATEVHHQLVPGVSVSAGYYYNWDGNIRALLNEAVGTGDFDPYCITTPVDAGLPGGGGQRTCGLYNVSASKFGQSRLVWKNSRTLDPDGVGSTRVSHFVNAQLDVRLKGGVRIGGGIDAGQSIWDTCFVIDNPQETSIVFVTANVGQRAVDQRFCREVQPWLANLQLKLNGSTPLPGGTTMSVTLQNVAGQEIRADYNATATEIAGSLGRAPSGGVRTVSIPLIAPYTAYEGRRSQLDVRMAKTLGLGAGHRLQASVDIYNLFNGNAVLARTDTYGPRWNQPTNILPGRMLQLGGTLTF